MWYFMLHSGVHASISGVILAFTIPITKRNNKSLSIKLETYLNKPVAFLILPIFALANTAIIINSDWHTSFTQPYSFGILSGLIIGKPIGILLFSFISVVLGLCILPSDLKWKYILGASILAGIGFTMSIFITLLAFKDAQIINNSKFMILCASFISGTIGFIFLKIVLKKDISENGSTLNN